MFGNHGVRFQVSAVRRAMLRFAELIKGSDPEKLDPDAFLQLSEEACPAFSCTNERHTLPDLSRAVFIFC